MKRVFIPLFVLFSLASFAQTEKNPFPRTITVNGSAEMEIIPDEIYVQVDLREYEKKGQPKVNIDKIRQDFLRNVRSLGIPDSAISISAYDGSNGNPWIRKKNKKEELLASITYELKLKSSKQIDDLVNLLDDNATQNFAIIRTSHSRIAEIRKQLKIQAVQAAREKANYLAQAIQEKAGQAITINEPGEIFIPMYNMNMRAKALMNESAQADDGQAPVDFRKIRYKYEVTVVFALQ